MVRANETESGIVAKRHSVRQLPHCIRHHVMTVFNFHHKYKYSRAGEGAKLIVNVLLFLLCGYFPCLFVIKDLKLISMGVGKELCCYSALVTVHYLVIIPAPWLETIWTSRQNVANNMNLFTIQELAA